MDENFFRAGEIGISVAYIVLPFILGMIHVLVKGAKEKKWNILFLYYLCIGIGVQGIVTGLAQILIPETISKNLEWTNSLFLLELGMANLAFGAVAIVSPWMDRSWNSAAAFAYSIFLFLTGMGHLIELIQIGPNPGNAGGFLYSDLLVPILTMTCWGLSRKKKYATFISLE